MCLLMLVLALGCRTVGTTVCIDKSSDITITVRGTDITAEQGKTINPETLNPRIQDNAVPVNSPNATTTSSRDGDTSGDVKTPEKKLGTEPKAEPKAEPAQ
jgi:hypothetical protein